MHIVHGVKMARDENYQALEEEFSSTFIRDLIPGILHNFANPLNSIMGRSKLLQRRFEDFHAKITDKYPQVAQDAQDELQRLKTEIRAINNESEIFFDLFKSLTGKFYMLDSKLESRINLSQLLSDELRFFFFYLDFKHEIKKAIKLNYDVPSFKGNSAELSLAFWKLIRFAMSRSLASVMKEFYLETQYDQKYVSAVIRDSGGVLPATDIEGVIKQFNCGGREAAASVIDRGVLYALLILKKYQAKVSITSKEGISAISLSFPYQGSKTTAQI